MLPRHSPHPSAPAVVPSPVLLRPAFCALLVLCLAGAAPRAAGQSQTLLTEDFETGAPAWTFANTPGNGLWHIAASGSCGAVTQMAAYNDPASCFYITGGSNFGYLVSPAVLLSGEPPFTLGLDYLCQVDGVGELLCVQISEAGSGSWSVVACNAFLNDGLLLTGAQLGISSAWAGHSVQLRFLFVANLSHNNFPGWEVDNLVLSNGGGWTDLGQAKPGGAGAPQLTGTGTLAGNSSNQLDLANANPSSVATLVFGLSQLGAPFKDGVLVPVPLLLIPLATDPAGATSLPFVLPPGIPAGTTLVFQFWIEDPPASFGLAASNGLFGSTS